MEKNVRKRCFIGGCYAKIDKENKEIAFFSVPPGSLEAWQKLIPKSGLCSGSKVCSRHFDAEDVKKGRTIQEKFYPTKWRLKEGAKPKHLLGTGTETKSTSVVKRKSCAPVANKNLPICQGSSDASPRVHKSTSQEPLASLPHPLPEKAITPTSTIAQKNYETGCQPLTIIVLDDAVFASAQSTSITPVPQSSSSTDPLSCPPPCIDHDYGMVCPDPVPAIPVSFSWNYAAYQDFIRGVKLPSSDWNWSFNVKQKILLCSANQFLPDGKLIAKTIKMLNNKEVEFFFNGKLVAPSHLPREFSGKAGLSDLIMAFNEKKPCVGIEDQSLETLEVTKNFSGFKEKNIWWSKECTGIADVKLLCNKCRVFKRYLKKRVKYSPKKKDPQLIVRKLKTMRRRNARAKIREEGLIKDASILRKEVLQLKLERFDDKIKILTPREQLIVKTMVTKAEIKPKRGGPPCNKSMRYDPEFVKECRRIKDMSTNAYKYLRFNGFLPLPSLNTLSRISRNAKTTSAVESSGQSTVENEVEMPEDAEDNMSVTSDCVETGLPDTIRETIVVDTGSADVELSVSPEVTVVEILSTE